MTTTLERRVQRAEEHQAGKDKPGFTVIWEDVDGRVYDGPIHDPDRHELSDEELAALETTKEVFRIVYTKEWRVGDAREDYRLQGGIE